MCVGGSSKKNIRKNGAGGLDGWRAVAILGTRGNMTGMFGFQKQKVKIRGWVVVEVVGGR